MCKRGDTTMRSRKVELPATKALERFGKGNGWASDSLFSLMVPVLPKEEQAVDESFVSFPTLELSETAASDKVAIDALATALSSVCREDAPMPVKRRRTNKHGLVRSKAMTSKLSTLGRSPKSHFLLVDARV